MTERQILTPGEAPTAAVAEPPPARKKPGPKPKAEREAAAAALTGDDDLAEYESDDLPPAPPAPPGSFTPEQQALIGKMIADAVRASKSSQDPATAAKLAAKANQPEKLPTEEEARAMCEDAIARGQRPRAILTASGWFVHPESARTKSSGVSALGGDA